mgnify:CR=1 FL=1
MESQIEKEYTTEEKLKIISNSRYIKIIKNKENLKQYSVYIPIKRNGQIVYVVVEK